MTEERRPSKFAFILHADIAGSTALVQRDEQVAHDRIQDTFRRFGDIIAQYHGHVRELRGDALLAEFERASDAVSATLAFQVNQDEYTAQLNDNILPMVRVGIAMGEVVVADNTVTGEGVVLAQRVEQLADPGSVCITGAIHEALPSRMPFDQDDLGEQEVKGFDELVRVYTVRLRQGTELPEPTIASATKRTSAMQWTMVGIVVVLICGGGLLAWVQPWKPDFEPASVEEMAFPLPDKPSIAVLAFDNLSGDPEKEYMADGISEHIISTLARLPQLFIVSRNSTFYYKGKAVDVRQVAEELGVQYVLEGSLQTSGDSVRITAQLIDALSGLHVWSEHYDRSVDDFFALQDDITHKIAVALQVELTRGEQALIETQTTTNLKAWLKFQQAFEAYGAFTPDGNRLARKLLHEAVELDPYFAQAWTFLGWTHFIDARLGYSESRTESLTKSNELVDKAASVHPELPELYLLRAFLHMIEGELDEAIILGRKLLEVAPGSSNYHAGNAMIMLFTGEFDASIEFMQKAKRLSPLGRTWYDLTLGRAYLLKRDYESAAATFERITTEDTSPVIAAGGHTSMAVLYMETGREDKARKEIEKALSRASWLSISFYRRVAHYKDPANWRRFETALAKAGLPE